VVVDDEEDARELLRAVLAGAGVTVTAAASAAEALAAVSRVRPQVLISDIGLTGEDGYELIQRIRVRESQDGGYTAAIAVTAYASDADRSHALAAGYDVHLSKPLEFSRLLSTIARLTQSPAAVVRLSDHKKRTAD
jgi:CheY-like chemotaxis protein